MINTDLDSAEELYGGETIWYVYSESGNHQDGSFSMKLDGPFDFYEAEAKKDLLIDCTGWESKSGIKVLADWDALRKCCEKMFGK